MDLLSAAVVTSKLSVGNAQTHKSDELSMVAFPATSRRNAICTASALSMWPGFTYSVTSLLIRSSFGCSIRLSTRLAM